MKELFKSIGGFFIGIAGFIMIGFIAIMFIEGGAWLGTKILPWLYLIMWLLIAINILILLPMAIFKKTVGLSAIGFAYSSLFYGLTGWFMCLVLTYVIWGGLAVFIGLFMLGIGVVPIAMLATAINGNWRIFGQIIMLLFFTFGSRFFGFYLAQRADRLADKANRISFDDFIQNDSEEITGEYIE